MSRDRSFTVPKSNFGTREHWHEIVLIPTFGCRAFDGLHDDIIFFILVCFYRKLLKKRRPHGERKPTIVATIKGSTFYQLSHTSVLLCQNPCFLTFCSSERSIPTHFLNLFAFYSILVYVYCLYNINQSVLASLFY